MCTDYIRTFERRKRVRECCSKHTVYCVEHKNRYMYNRLATAATWYFHECINETYSVTHRCIGFGILYSPPESALLFSWFVGDYDSERTSWGALHTSYGMQDAIYGQWHRNGETCHSHIKSRFMTGLGFDEPAISVAGSWLPYCPCIGRLKLLYMRGKYA